MRTVPFTLEIKQFLAVPVVVRKHLGTYQEAYEALFDLQRRIESMPAAYQNAKGVMLMYYGTKSENGPIEIGYIGCGVPPAAEIPAGFCVRRVGGPFITARTVDKPPQDLIPLHEFIRNTWAGENGMKIRREDEDYCFHVHTNPDERPFLTEIYLPIETHFRRHRRAG